MFEAVKNPFLVSADQPLDIDQRSTTLDDSYTTPIAGLKTSIKQLQGLQRGLYAHNHFAVLLVFQAMDAAGKDSTIRAVLGPINPTGCQVFSFKKPSEEELDHDFLWRTTRNLPERGRIGVFNRSYYEEVLVVRVHPSILDGQRLPNQLTLPELFEERLHSIAQHERHLAANGVVVIKFFLHVSKEEQRKRLLDRLKKPNKQWKFSIKDVDERDHWAAYMKAYEEAINYSSVNHAPWYVIPADDKKMMRKLVAKTIVDSLSTLNIEYPSPDRETLERKDEMMERLQSN